jgi:3-oxoacyl-[acyl-carrier protein] reductase
MRIPRNQRVPALAPPDPDADTLAAFAGEGQGPQGEVALVTGATSGIGSAVCRSMARAGCHVVVNYHTDAQAAQVLADQLSHVVRSLVIRADVADPADVDRMFATAEASLGTVSVLVNNASFSAPELWEADPLSIPLPLWQRCLDVDLTGTYLCCRRAIPGMVKRGRGKIVNFSSSGSLTGDADTFSYNPAKTAVTALSRSLAKTYAPIVQVNTVAPGSINTGWIEHWGLTAHEVSELKAMKTMPRRLGEPEEVAELVAFLTSPESDYITGQILNIDGGTSL